MEGRTYLGPTFDSSVKRPNRKVASILTILIMIVRTLKSYQTLEFGGLEFPLDVSGRVF